MNESPFFANLALQAFDAEQLAFHFFVKLGWLSAFFVFLFNLKSESRLRSWFWMFGGVSLIPPALFYATNWVLAWLEFRPMPIPVADALVWFGLVGWRRGHGRFLVALHHPAHQCRAGAFQENYCAGAQPQKRRARDCKIPAARRRLILTR